MKRSIEIVTYCVLAFNSLFAVLFCLDYSLYEIDLFLVIWMCSTTAIFSFPIGIGLSIYAIFRKESPLFRIVAPIWTGAIIALFVLAFYVLPSGAERISNGMEKQYVTNHDAIMQLCRYATDSLSLPDSTALVITAHNRLQTRRVIGRNAIFPNPALIATQDTIFDIDERSAQRLMQLHKAARVDAFSVYMPDSLVNIHFVHRGFGRFWYEIPHHPYTEHEMYFQLVNPRTCPYSPDVCFCFDGGAIGHKNPYPVKAYFLQSHNIDSTYIYNLFH